MCATTTGDARIGDWSSRYPSVSLPSKRPTVCPTSNGEISPEGSCTSTGGRHDRVFVPDGPTSPSRLPFRLPLPLVHRASLHLEPACRGVAGTVPRDRVRHRLGPEAPRWRACRPLTRQAAHTVDSLRTPKRP